MARDNGVKRQAEDKVVILQLIIEKVVLEKEKAKTDTTLECAMDVYKTTP